MGSSWETTGRWFKQQMPKMYDSKCQTRRELGLREQWVDAQRGEREETVGITHSNKTETMASIHDTVWQLSP